VSRDLSDVSSGHPAYGENAVETWKVHGDLPYTFIKTSKMDSKNFTMLEDEA